MNYSLTQIAQAAQTAGTPVPPAHWDLWAAALQYCQLAYDKMPDLTYDPAPPTITAHWKTKEYRATLTYELAENGRLLYLETPGVRKGQLLQFQALMQLDHQETQNNQILLTHSGHHEGTYYPTMYDVWQAIKEAKNNELTPSLPQEI